LKDMDDLEKELRKAIIEQQLGTHRLWRKIFLLVEGIYRLAKLYTMVSAHCFGVDVKICLISISSG